MNLEKRYEFDSKIDFDDSSAESNSSLQVDPFSNGLSALHSDQNAFGPPSEKNTSLCEHKSNEDKSKVVTIGSVRFAAMSYLAAREHSQKELVQKLNRRFEDHFLVEQAVQQLADESLQCDDRFTEAFTGMRKRKGQGPIRIAYELQQKGVSPELIETYVYDTPEEEWLELAKEVCLRKYGEFSETHSLRAKQMRFLQYRGFTSDTIRQLWR